MQANAAKATGLAAFFLALAISAMCFAPSQAHATQNVDDGVYAFRYNAATSWSLDVPDASYNSVNVNIYRSNSSTAQYMQVKYDSVKDAYKITPICALDKNMVLSGNGNVSKNTLVNTQSDSSRDDQRWVFRQNPNGSWSICNKENQSVCVNLANDDRKEFAPVQLYTYASDDIASQWKMSKVEGASVESITKLVDANTVFKHSTFMLENARNSEPEILSMPSGWSKTYKEGHLVSLNCNNGVYRGAGDQNFKIMYRNVADVAGEPIDVQVDLAVKPNSNDSKYDYQNDGNTGNFIVNRTDVNFKWDDNVIAATGDIYGFFAGICCTHCTDYDITYTVYSHDTGKQISLEGAYITVGSLNGNPFYGDGTKARYEGVKYNSSKPNVKSYVMQDNFLTLHADGYWVGNMYQGDNYENYEDKIGGKNSEKVAVSYLIQDASPRFSFHNTANSECSAQWEFPLFMPLGVIAPNDPIKEVVISE